MQRASCTTVGLTVFVTVIIFDLVNIHNYW